MNIALIVSLSLSPATAQPETPWPTEPIRRIETAKKDAKNIPPVGCLLFSPDSKVLAYSAGDLRLFDLEMGKDIKQIDRRVYWPISMKFCQKGECLVFLHQARTLYFWNWRTEAAPTKFYESSKESLFALAVRERGDALAVTELSKDEAHYWRNKDKPDNKMVLPGSRHCPLSFVLGEKALLAGFGVFDAVDGKEKTRIVDKEYSGATQADVFIPTFGLTTPDGNYLLLQTSRQFRFWRLADGKVEREWALAGDDRADWGFLSNERLAFSPDGRLLALAGGDRSIRILDAHKGTLSTKLKAEQGQHFYSLAFSPDGRFLASGGDDGSVLVWRTK